LDLIEYFRNVTPDSLHYVIRDLFETITLYENKITQAEYQMVSNDLYEVSITLDLHKHQFDSAGIAHQVKINEWVDLSIYEEVEGGTEKLIYSKEIHVTNKITKVKMQVDKKPGKCVLDPKRKTMDREFDDNSKVLSDRNIPPAKNIAMPNLKRN
jgi:hypothetical protein